MRGGFTFNNVDIADVFLEYVPELEDTYVYRPTGSRAHEETFDGHDGGYLYGFTKEPKEFTLRCFFEEKDINRGTIDKIHWLFRKGNSGKLIFQKRPWCYYYATVMDVDDKELLNYLNGIIKITMKAFYPFARSDSKYIEKYNPDYFKIMESTAFFDNESMVPKTDIVNDVLDNSPITEETSFLLYNPGNEYADLGIEIAGECPEGVVIKNETTGQQCKFVALTNAVTTSENSFIYLDGINGKCVLRTPTEDKLNYLYHDYGYVQLEPASFIKRDIFVSSTDRTIVNTTNYLYDLNIGNDIEYARYLYKDKYIYLNNEWRKIKDVASRTSFELYEQIGSVENKPTVITSMNELKIIPVADMNITKLKFNYKPTFA